MSYIDAGFDKDIRKEDSTQIPMNPETIGSVVPDGSLGGSVLKDKTITASQLADDSVTAEALADASVATAAIADGSIDTDKLANLAVEASKLANSAVTTSKIANAAVGSAAIADLAVGSAAIADGAILRAKIADLAVNDAKIENLDGGKINAHTITADEIAAGTITADEIKTGTITTSKLNFTPVEAGGSASDVNNHGTTISYNKIRTGTLELGGSGNGSGAFSLKNGGGTEIVSMNKDGVTVRNGGNYYVNNGGRMWFREGGEIRLTTSSSYVSGFITNYAYSSSAPYKVCTFSTHQYSGQTSGAVFSAPSAGAYNLYLGNRHVSSTKFESILLYATNLWFNGDFKLGNGTDALRHKEVIVTISGTSSYFDVAHGGASRPTNVSLSCCGGNDKEKIFTTWDFDHSDSTNVRVNWKTIDGSTLSSADRRFHLIFYWA